MRAVCFGAIAGPNLIQYPDADASNNAFYEIGRLIAGPWLQVVIALAVAIGAAIANALVAQAATSRLLFAMARDRQMPRFLRADPSHDPSAAARHPAGGGPEPGAGAVLCRPDQPARLHVQLRCADRLPAPACGSGLASPRRRSPAAACTGPAGRFHHPRLCAVQRRRLRQGRRSCWMVLGLAVLAFLRLSGRTTEFKANDAVH